MHDPLADPLIAAITGRAATSERIDSARRHLVMLCSLLEEVRETVPVLVPPSTGSWRGAAAEHYLDGLDELRSGLFGARDRLSDAVYALEERIRQMEVQLETQAHEPVAER